MAVNALKIIEADLAPGDLKALRFDFRGFEFSRIGSSDDPLFAIAYETLWKEFGAHHEMETLDVIKKRLAWYPTAKIGDSWLRYERSLLQRNDPNGQRDF